MNDCCTIHTHEKRTESFGQLLVMERRYDPTRTTTLRNRFAREMRRRFVKLQREVREAIIDKDVFGMQVEQFGQPLLTQVERQAFSFPRSQDKVTAFMEWLQGRVDNGILEIRQGEQLGEAVEHAWTNQYVTDSYKRGVQRATYEMQRAGYPVTGIEERGGMQVVMNTPFHMDRVGLLYARVYSDLKGVTTAMDTQISRVLSQGMADGDGPRLLARKINAAISGVGAGDLGITDTLGRFIPAKRRAEMIARTEVIRAHHQATIQEYKNWRVAGVKVKAEWRTAGDGRVCEECEMLSFSEWTLDQIENAIPVHPHCRCIALPLDITDKGVPGEIEEEFPETIDAETLFESGNPLDFNSLPKNVKEKIQEIEWDSTNAALRFGADRINHARKADTLFKKHGISLPADTTVYRGVKGSPYSIIPEESFNDIGFFRYSGSRARAGHFVHKNMDGQMLSIKLPKGTKTIPGAHDHELEALLPRNSRFKVKGVKKIKNGVTIGEDGDWIPAWIYDINIELIP